MEISISNLQIKVGPAQGLMVEITDDTPDINFKYLGMKEIPYIFPGQSFEFDVPIEAGFDVKTAEHKLKIDVKEYYGYDMDPAYLVLNTLEYQKSKLVFSGLEIVDVGEGTGAIQEDGQLQAGELVKVKVVVQNIGQNIAENTKYSVLTNDNNIYIDEGLGELGDLKIGEVKEFWVTISPNKRVSYEGNIPVYLTLSEQKGKGNLNSYNLPIALDQKPPATEILTVEADIEKITRQVARFEYNSNKFTANIGNIENIRMVEQAKTVRDNAIAVVIGVEEYTDLPPAPYAENDAKLMKEYFAKRLGIKNVVIFTNEQVSGFAFDDIFNPDYGELQKAVIKGQTDVFVFYSGHGVPSKDGFNIYLFPNDGKIARLETQGYNMNKFYENLMKLEAKSVTVIMDACFSGASRTSEKKQTENLVAMKGGVKIKPQTIRPWITNPNFSVFSSSSFDETSLGFDPTQTGLYTYYLCVGLKGDADLDKDNKITTGELHDYLKENVMNTSKKVSGVQTPEFYGNSDMVLVEY